MFFVLGVLGIVSVGLSLVVAGLFWTVGVR
jgi:hypothetical protein